MAEEPQLCTIFRDDDGCGSSGQDDFLLSGTQLDTPEVIADRSDASTAPQNPVGEFSIPTTTTTTLNMFDSSHLWLACESPLSTSPSKTCSHFTQVIEPTVQCVCEVYREFESCEYSPPVVVAALHFLGVVPNSKIDQAKRGAHFQGCDQLKQELERLSTIVSSFTITDTNIKVSFLTVIECVHRYLAANLFRLVKFNLVERCLKLTFHVFQQIISLCSSSNFECFESSDSTDSHVCRSCHVLLQIFCLHIKLLMALNQTNYLNQIYVKLQHIYDPSILKEGSNTAGTTFLSYSIFPYELRLLFGSDSHLNSNKSDMDILNFLHHFSKKIRQILCHLSVDSDKDIWQNRLEDVYIRMAQIGVNLKDYAMVVRLLKKAIKINESPVNDTAVGRSADFYMMNRKADLLSAIARIHIQIGDIEGARRSFSQALHWRRKSMVGTLEAGNNEEFTEQKQHVSRHVESIKTQMDLSILHFALAFNDQHVSKNVNMENPTIESQIYKMDKVKSALNKALESVDHIENITAQDFSGVKTTILNNMALAELYEGNLQRSIDILTNGCDLLAGDCMPSLMSPDLLNSNTVLNISTLLELQWSSTMSKELKQCLLQKITAFRSHISNFNAFHPQSLKLS